MRPWLKALGLLLLATVAYLAFWPVPIDPEAWQPPTNAGYRGPHAANTRLAPLRRVSIAPDIGPEHFEVGPDGAVYTGVLSGAILRIDPVTLAVQRYADTGGRPLGIAFAPDGGMLVADALRGLLAVHADGSTEVLADRVGSDPIRFADAVAVGANGDVYFTDASRRFPAREWGTFDAALIDLLEHSCTGRVLRYVPATAEVRVVIGDLCFPNGVAVASDQRHLFIAETGVYQVWKVLAAAEGLSANEHRGEAASDEARVILANLPGYPDNLTLGADGRLWTGLTKPRSALLDRLSGWPALRAVTLRLPKALWPVPPAYGHVLAFDESGRVVADLQDPAGGLEETSGATEAGGRLFVHSLHAPAFGVLDAIP